LAKIKYHKKNISAFELNEVKISALSVVFSSVLWEAQ